MTERRRLALIMLDRHLGNFLVASPVLCALTKRFPDVQTLIHGPHEALASRIPGFPSDRVAVSPPANRAAELPTVLHEIVRLRRWRPHVLADFGGSGIGSLIGGLSGAAARACPAGATWRRLYTIRADKPASSIHRIAAYVAIGDAVAPGLEWSNPVLHATQEDREALASILEDEGMTDHGRLVCLHVAGGKDYKHWPLDRYATVADALYERGLQPVLIGAAPDRASADQVLSLSRRRPLDLVTRMGLGALIALFERATLFLGNDSGPMHMAAAAGTPIVALFGPTDPRRWGPLTEKASIVRGTDPIAMEGTKRKFHGGTRMDSISVEAVLQAVERATGVRPDQAFAD